MSSSSSMVSIPDEALAFAGFVLAHCAAVAEANRDGELVCPFAVLRDAEKQQRLVHFESETQAEAVEKGWRSLTAAQSTGSAWAFAREGIFKSDNVEEDVLTVSTWLPTMTAHFSVLQRFRRGTNQELVLFGEPVLFVHEPDGAAQVDAWNRSALSAGVRSHPRGDRWLDWFEKSHRADG